MIHIDRPNPADAPPWCPYFFGLVPENDLLTALQNNKKSALELISAIPPGKADYRYADDKWTIKEVLVHLTDTERFYAYSAFCISRQVEVYLHFDDRDSYVHNSNAASRHLEDIAAEFAAIREATISLFSNLTPSMLDFRGTPGKPVYTARSLGWMCVGHNIHHSNILLKKYLTER